MRRIDPHWRGSSVRDQRAAGVPLAWYPARRADESGRGASATHAARSAAAEAAQGSGWQRKRATGGEDLFAEVLALPRHTGRLYDDERPSPRGGSRRQQTWDQGAAEEAPVAVRPAAPAASPPLKKLRREAAETRIYCFFFSEKTCLVVGMYVLCLFLFIHI